MQKKRDDECVPCRPMRANQKKNDKSKTRSLSEKLHGEILSASEAAAAAAAAAAATSELAEVTVGTLSTATAARTAATTAAVGRLTGNGLQKAGNLLVGLLKKLKKLANDTTVTPVEKGSGVTGVSGTTSTTNTVDVVVNVGGQVVVDDMGNVGDIETTSGNSGGNQNGAATVAEELQSALTLTLSAVTVNRGGGEVLVDQEVGQRVGHALGLDENEGETGTVGVENIQENRALVDVLDVLDLLGNVLRGGTNTTNGQENVVLQEVASEHLDVAGEGGGEHESLAVLNIGHVLALDDTANLGLETHVKHAVSLIEHKVLDVLEGDAATLDKIDKTSGGGNEQVAAALDLTKLGADVGTTVDDTRADPGAVRELAGLFVDLGNQLTSGSQNQRCGVSLALTAETTGGVGRDRRRTVDEGLGQNGEKETTSLSGTSLSTSHKIATAHNDRDRVLLDGGGNLVASHLDVADEVVVERGVGEGEDGLRDVVSRSLDGDVVVLLKVDTGLLLGCVVDTSAEELALDTGVGRAGNVLAVAPLAVAGATSLLATTTTSVTAVAAAVSTAAATAFLPATTTTTGWKDCC
ncbi:uncharacterized protein ColSpa_01026 [Colletotrichum spaethianum]|uniref:Uncharacterized protein n=1 Tax=Colletotrichum spaethianum TaxID=700344 RepID=A0AA37L352_9PEZI|nr:uncharacterized protein ColSpa_01026 [Colletotrichum spaethianum]GKT40846.1 hypothetical protein ColSpa_01026 [Colletotrichum spaethianum]